MVTYMDPQTEPSYTVAKYYFQVGLKFWRASYTGRPDSDDIFLLPPKIKILNLHIVR